MQSQALYAYTMRTFRTDWLGSGKDKRRRKGDSRIPKVTSHNKTTSPLKVATLVARYEKDMHHLEMDEKPMGVMQDDFDRNPLVGKAKPSYRIPSCSTSFN